MSLRCVTTIAECQSEIAERREAGSRIGFVPTMGHLHEGHLSLVDRSCRMAETTVVSIFVNPLQFGPGEDYARYPRDLEKDLQLCEGRGVDLVFAPPAEEVFPVPPVVRVTMEGVTDLFEGEARPGHFDGVLTIVAKLFNIIDPDVAVFGQKDAQQTAAVKRLVADLDFGVEIVVAPTVREPDGLACSSRNAYLDKAERLQAPGIFRALSRASEMVEGGEYLSEEIVAAMREVLAGFPAINVEYVAVVNAERFTPVPRVEGSSVAIIAARIGATRLIDNVILSEDDE